MQRTVPDFRLQRVMLDQRVEVMVGELRIELAREHQRAKDIGMKFDPDAAELGFQELVVEARVVGDEEAPGQSRRRDRPRYP